MFIATRFLPFSGKTIKYYPTKKENPLGLPTALLMYGVNVPLDYVEECRNLLLRGRRKHKRKGVYPKWTTLPNGQVINEANPPYWLRDTYWNGVFNVEKYRKEFGLE